MELQESFLRARTEATTVKGKLFTLEKKHTALETVARIRSEEIAQLKTAMDRKAQEAIHFQRVTQESEKKRLEAVKVIAAKDLELSAKDLELSECKQLVKTLQDDLSVQTSRADELEHRLVVSENSFPDKIAAHMESDDYSRELDISEVKLLRAFAAKLATKFPDQGVAMVAATEVFCAEYYDSTYPDGLPPAEENTLLSADLPAFDSFDPSS